MRPTVSTFTVWLKGLLFIGGTMAATAATAMGRTGHLNTVGLLVTLAAGCTTAVSYMDNSAAIHRTAISDPAAILKAGPEGNEQKDGPDAEGSH